MRTPEKVLLCKSCAVECKCFYQFFRFKFPVRMHKLPVAAGSAADVARGFSHPIAAWWYTKNGVPPLLAEDACFDRRCGPVIKDQFMEITEAEVQEVVRQQELHERYNIKKEETRLFDAIWRAGQSERTARRMEEDLRELQRRAEEARRRLANRVDPEETLEERMARVHKEQAMQKAYIPGPAVVKESLQDDTELPTVAAAPTESSNSTQKETTSAPPAGGV